MSEGSGFEKLLLLSDKIAREELGNYYIISESRMNNYLHCLESGADEIKNLRTELAAKDNEIERLKAELKRSDQAIFDNIIEPNCATCSQQISSMTCDNGIVCVGKVKEGQFINWQEKKAEAENAALRERLKPVEYQDHEFCKDIGCPGIKENKCITTACLESARTFHKWLNEHEFKICKAMEEK